MILEARRNSPYEEASGERADDDYQGVYGWSEHDRIIAAGGMTFKRRCANLCAMKSVYEASAAGAFAKAFGNSALRPVSVRCLVSILRNFFLSQFRLAFFPGRVPVSRVDHPLDSGIPFTPAWIGVYVDFVAYWLRMLVFLRETYGRKSLGAIAEFAESIGRLYSFAAKVYRKNLSTMERPFYVSRRRFFVIHLLDPHLMCVPSLHVMVAAFAHAKFAAILRSFGEAETRSDALGETMRGALAICASVLFVKQHSVNCIGASLYALTRFDAELFPPEKAEEFCSRLFEPPCGSPSAETGCLRSGGKSACPNAENCRKCPLSVPGSALPSAVAAEIRAHVAGSYRRFSDEGKGAKNWEDPLLNFLREMPRGKTPLAAGLDLVRRRRAFPGLD